MGVQITMATNITAVLDHKGKPLAHYIDSTLIIDLPQPLQSGEKYRFQIDWNYLMNDASVVWARTGYEHLRMTTTRSMRCPVYPRLQCSQTPLVG